jgi:hypothetical protein
VTLIESTSPSSLLTASLDAARRHAAVHGRELLGETLELPLLLAPLAGQRLLHADGELAAARAAGALGAFLAGAGSTVAALVDATDESAADRVGAAFRSTATSLGQPGRLQAFDTRAAGARLVTRR